MINSSSITSMDWIKLIIFWVLINISRLIMLVMFLPFWKFTGYGLNRKEFLILVYGGLRGTLGVTLALMVGIDTELPERLKDLCLFYMSGTVALSMLINGTTCK